MGDVFYQIGSDDKSRIRWKLFSAFKLLSIFFLQIGIIDPDCRLIGLHLYDGLVKVRNFSSNIL